MISTPLKYFPFLLLVNLSLFSQEGVKIDRNLEDFISLNEVKLLKAENLTVESPGIDSMAWEDIPLGGNANETMNTIDGTAWLFAEIQITESLDSEKELTLNLINIGSSNEIYWDAILIGRKVVIRELDKKENDLVDQIVKIPYNRTTPGTHRLLIKTFNDARTKIFQRSRIEIGFYKFFVERQIEQQYFKVFFMAILFASAIFSLVLFFGFNKNIEYLFFGIYCFANSRRAYLFPFMKIEAHIEAALAHGNIGIGFILYIFTNISLLAYLIAKFSIHKTHKAIASIILLSPFSVFIIPQNVYGERIHYVIMTILPFIIVFYALYRKKVGSLYILIGITGLNTLTYLENFGLLQQTYFIGIFFLVVCILILSSKEIANQSRKHREAVLRTARLENELLKRHIQPHFILNTLTSLQEFVEQSPKKASKLIQALAEEFQLFSKVSGEKLIPITDELKMCNAHLRIMDYRKGVKFEFSTQGIDGTEKIPPGIFHTCIENGTTHGYINKKKGKFTLKKEHLEKHTRYIIFNDSESQDIPEGIRKGTGLKYIEARLEESFPGSWKCASLPVQNGWEVIIEI